MEFLARTAFPMASDAHGVTSWAGFNTEKKDWELTKATIRLKSVTKSLDIIFKKIEDSWSLRQNIFQVGKKANNELKEVDRFFLHEKHWNISGSVVTSIVL
jgi:hypothetical protein